MGRTSVDSFDQMNNSFETVDESVNSHTETWADCDDQSNKSIYNTPTKPKKDVKTDVDITEEFNSILRQSPRKNKNHSVVTQMDTSLWSEFDKKIYLQARKKLQEERNEIINRINGVDY